MAHEGLARWGVSTAVRERYLDVIERRCVTKRTSAAWQLDTVAALEDRGMSREKALLGMLERYVAMSEANEPVHSWKLPA